MKIISDRARFDALQAELVSKIASAVRGHIRLVFDGRVPANLTEVTRDIVSSVASILDACDGGDDAGLPMLTFATSEAREELVVPGNGEGSWMHEYAHG
jgi:hypothetical protein